MDNKEKYKLLSDVKKPSEKHFTNRKYSKLCLSGQQKTISAMNVHREKGNLDHSLLTDDESDTSFDNKRQEFSSNPIFSSSSDVQSEVKVEKTGPDEDTFCSEIEDTPATGITVMKMPVNDGSESLFSTEAESSGKLSQQIEDRLSQEVKQLILGERFSGVKGNTDSTGTNEPLLLESDSMLGTTMSKDSSYLASYQRQVGLGIYDSIDSYQEKGQSDSPEKCFSTLNETDGKTESLAETENNTVCEQTSQLNETEHNTCALSENEEVVSISSGHNTQGTDRSESSEFSVICISDSDNDENNITRSSSHFEPVVSSIIGSLDVTASSVVDKFFDQVPLLSTPECTNYMKSFYPRRSNNVTEEIIEESDPEPDTQSNKASPVPKSDPNPEPQIQKEVKPSTASSTTSSSSSNEATITEINISANVQISIKVETPGNSSKKNTGTKRKNPPSSNKKKPNSPKPGPSKPFHEERTFRTPHFRKPEKENAKDLKNVQNQKAKTVNDSIEVDDFTSKCLDEVYGEGQWQTPQLKAKTVKRTGKDKSLLDFSTFNRNISANKLESTRLTNPAPPSNTPMYSSRSRVAEKHHKQTPVHKGAKPVTAKKNHRTPALAICDSDTSSNGSNAPISSDESWKGESSPNSTDSEVAQATKVRKRPISTRKRVIHPPSYSESDDDITETWTDKPTKMKSPLSNVLDSCEYKPKGKLPATPATGMKTKRKLFNPNKTCEEVAVGDEPDELVQEADDMDHDISQIQDDALSFRFALPFLSKSVELIRDKECGKTPAKTPSKKLDTPSSKTKKNVLFTPKDVVPAQKLGFLQSLDVNTSEQSCDPEALRYRQNYKNLKQELTDKLFALYNEHVFENELVAPCTWNKKLLNTAGRCHLTRANGLRKARIELSEKVLTSADRLRCTLIHEMCHAATWIYNGEDGHGKTWRAWAHKSNMIFKELPKINTCHSYEIFYKYTYMCKLCKAKSQAHSRSKKVENIRCKICHGSIEILLNKMNKDGQVYSTPVKSATGFAKFVQNNYSKLKRPEIGHAEVMKLLGENFGKLSVAEKALLN